MQRVQISTRLATLASEAKLLLHPYTVLVLVALAVWLPDGFNIGPVNDGWVTLKDANALILPFGLRVLQVVPQALGLLLTPGSFIGWQALLFVFTASRGILVFEIIARLIPNERRLALACGLLAVFHPADTVDFWVDGSNVDMALALALSACLAALMHLQTGSRQSLLAVFLFQLACCFTYPGYLLVLIAFPVCIWLLQWWQTRRASVVYLLKTTSGVLVVTALVLFESKQGAGREGYLWDPDVHRTLSGYGLQLKWIFLSVVRMLQGVQLTYLFWGLLPAVFAYTVAHKMDSSHDEPRPWRYHAGLAAMFLLLAAAAYFPYAVTTMRPGHNRQMLAAGLFIFMALLLPLFLSLRGRSVSRAVSSVLVMIVALGAVMTGLENRSWYVNFYRTKEALLAGIARVEPQPPDNAVFVVRVSDPDLARALVGFYNREPAFTEALRFIYGDQGLFGTFIDLDAEHPLDFGSSGLGVVRPNHIDRAPYSHLVLVDYSPDGTASLLPQAWLRQRAPKDVDISAYQPDAGARQPGKDAIICSILEKKFRPSYCD